MAKSSPRTSSSCFILRDSTRMGTILTHVVASHHTVCAQSDRIPAFGKCTNGLFQPSVGAEERRAVYFAHRRYRRRAQPGALPRWADGRSWLARARLG